MRNLARLVRRVLSPGEARLERVVAECGPECGWCGGPAGEDDYCSDYCADAADRCDEYSGAPVDRGGEPAPVVVCIPCGSVLDRFGDPADAVDAARAHDEQEHEGRPVAFVTTLDGTPGERYR